MILHTVSDTTLLVGNMKKLWLYNYKAGKVVDISKNAAQKDGIHVYSILQNNGKLWLGTESGLFILDLKNFSLNISKKKNIIPIPFPIILSTGFSRIKKMEYGLALSLEV
jgi:ligand-binding sensor domain-containing protein